MYDNNLQSMWTWSIFLWLGILKFRGICSYHKLSLDLNIIREFWWIWINFCQPPRHTPSHTLMHSFCALKLFAFPSHLYRNKVINCQLLELVRKKRAFTRRIWIPGMFLRPDRNAIGASMPDRDLVSLVIYSVLAAPRHRVF